MKKFNSKKILARSGMLLTASSLVSTQGAVNSSAISFNPYVWWLGLVGLYSDLMVYILGKQWLVSKIEDVFNKNFHIEKGEEQDSIRYWVAAKNSDHYSFSVEVVLSSGGSGFEVLSGKESLYKCDSTNGKNLDDLRKVLRNKFTACEMDAKREAALKIKKKISGKFSNVTFANDLNKYDQYVVTFNFSGKIKVSIPLLLQFKEDSFLPHFEKIGTAESITFSFFENNTYDLDDKGLGRMVKDLENWYDAVCSDIDKLEELVEKYWFSESCFFEDDGKRWLIFSLKEGFSVKIKKEKGDFLLESLVYDIENRKILAKNKGGSVDLFSLKNEKESKEFETFLSNLKVEIEKRGSFTPLAEGEKKEISVDIWQSELSS